MQESDKEEERVEAKKVIRVENQPRISFKQEEGRRRDTDMASEKREQIFAES